MQKDDLRKILSLVVTALVGLFLLIYPADTLNLVIAVIGGALLLLGVIGIVSYFLPKNRDKRDVRDLVSSVAEAIVGVLFLTNMSFVLSLFPVIFGILVALQGIVYLFASLRMKKANNEYWKLGLALSLVMIAFGVVVFANPLSSQAAMVRLEGIALIYNAVSGLIIYLKS